MTSSLSTTQSPSYRPDIDALRALAVIPVVVFHLGANWLPGGFLGVDVFFVISGYLITGLLLRELNGGRIELLEFWRRRILRILPALLVMVLAVFILGQTLLYAPDRYMLSVNAAGALLSFGNITHWRNYGGYWSADATDSPLLHTWSLGVEEQFYILYPLILLIAWHFLKNRTWWLLASVMTAGAVLYTFASQWHPAAAFYLFPTRAWELLAGAVAAAFNFRRLPGKTGGVAMSLSGIALIFAAYLLGGEKQQAPGSLTAVLGASLVVAAGSPQAFARLCLTSRPVVLLGLISYSVYLWHWPLIVLGRALEIRRQTHVPSLFYFAASLCLGWISWRFVESPTRRERRRWVPPALLTAAIGFSLLFYSFRDSNATERTPHTLTARWDGEIFNVNPVATWPEHVRRRMHGIDVTPRPSRPEDAYLHGINHHYGNHSKLDVLVLGDSHGLMWSPAIDAAARDLGLNVRYMTADGTGVFFNPERPDAASDGNFFSRQQLSAFNRARLETVRRERPHLVVIGSAWNSRGSQDAIALLHEIVKWVDNVLLVEDAPDFAIGDRNAPSYMAYLGIVPDAEGRAYSRLTDPQRAAIEDKTVRMLAASCSSKCSVIQTRDLFEDRESNVLIIESGMPMFIDDDHLSVAGAMRVQPRFEVAIQKAIANARDESHFR